MRSSSSFPTGLRAQLSPDEFFVNGPYAVRINDEVTIDLMPADTGGSS